MAINKLPGFGALDLNNQEIIRATNVIPLYEEGTAYAVGDQVITTNENGNPTLYTFNVGTDSAPATFPMEMVTEAGTAPGVSVGALLPTTTIADDDAPLGELFSLTENAGGRLAGLYRRIADSGNQAAWENVVDKFHVDTALQTGAAAVGTFYSQSGAFATPVDTTYTFAEDKTAESATISDLQVFVDGASTATTSIPLGANQITAAAGNNGSALIQLARNNEVLTNPNHEVRVNMAHELHGAVTASDNPVYMEWASPAEAGGALELNTQGLISRFEDTYRKGEIESWVENDIPVDSKQAIQYYEVQGRPNRDETAVAGALSSEDVEFSQFEVDLGLQRRTGVVSDYHTRAISFTLDSSQATDNIGHWTIAPGVRGTIFVIKDGVYKEFQLVDTDTGRSPDQLLLSIAFDHLGDLIGSHDDHYIRVGAERGVMFNFKLSELNGDPSVGIGVRKSTTHFKNEAITAISVQYHVDGENHNVQTIGFGTSQGHVSYISNRINANGLVAADYITDYFNTDDVTVFGNPIFPTGVRYPGINYVIASYPANTTKDNVWVKDIKWIGQSGEFIAVGDHQDSTIPGFDPPGSELGGPLVAYFRNIRALSDGDLTDGQIHYLTTPFREEFFDNVFAVRNVDTIERPLTYEPTEGDGSRIPTLDQIFNTSFSSVVQVTVGTIPWVYLFGSREIRNQSNQVLGHRAFCIKATVTGAGSINTALNAFDNDGTSIQGGIRWELVNSISEITGWKEAGSLELPPLNNAQDRYEVRGGANAGGITDGKIIDIFGNDRTVVDLNATTDVLTSSQEAEDGLAHPSNGWATTDVIWGGWIGNTGASDTSDETDGFQTLTIMGQSGNGGTTPLYGVSKYVAEITVTLRPLNGDASIVLGPIRVPDAQGELLRTNLLNRLAAEFNAPAAGVQQNAPANETATVSTYDSLYGVATISFASDTRDFDISVTTPDIHQIVNHDEDIYEFVLRFSQEFLAGEGQEIFVLAHPRLASVDGTAISPDDNVTLLTSATDSTPLDKSLYSIRFIADGLELEIFNTATNEPLPFGTLVRVNYGYTTPAFYQYVHNHASTIVFHDPYHGGSGSIHIPVGMAFADDNALVSYLVDKFSALFAATNIDVFQEGQSSIIEFRTTLRGDQVGDLILDDDQKIMITVTNPAINENLENVGVLQVNRLFDGRSDFPGKFASTFNFSDALTETDLRSVLHQVFNSVAIGDAEGIASIPVHTGTDDEAVLNALNVTTYNDNRLITEDYVDTQIVTKDLGASEAASFAGTVDFVTGTTIDATGTTWDFNNATLNNLTNHINIEDSGTVTEVTNLTAGTGIGITITNDTAEIVYTGATGGGITTVLTDGTTISGNGVDEALSVVGPTLGSLGTPTADETVPIWSETDSAWGFNTRASIAGVVKGVQVNAADTTQSFNVSTGVLNISSSFGGGGSGDGDVTAAGNNTFTGNNTFSGEINSSGDNTFTGDNVFETNGTKGFEVASYADDAGNGPSLVIDRKRQTSPNVNAVAVDGDDIGVIRFQGNDDKAGTNATYASIGASIDSAKDDNPVGQLYIKVADGNGAGGGKAGSHVRIEGKSNGGATIEIDSDADLTVDGTTTLNGTIVTNGPLTSDSVHVVSGTGHQLRSDANIILNGLVTGSGITTFTSAVLANRGIRSAVAGSGISITPSADGFSETFTSSNTVAQGNISIPSDSGIITATGDRDNIQRFLDRASLLRYVDLTDNTPIEAAPVRLNGRLLNNIRTEAESDGDFFLNNATQSSTSVTQGSAFNREWSEMSSVIMMGNPNNVSVEHWLLGDSLFIYQPNEARDRWAVYRVDSVGTTTSGDQYANLTYINSHGTPNISSTGSRDGDDVVVVGSLRDVVPDGAAFQYSTVIAFDSADGIKYRDTLDALTVEGVFDLIGSGIASNGTDITSAGNFNGAPVNAMAYLAIQLNSFEPVQVDASTTLSTVYADETVIAGGTSEDVAITYQAILDGSAAATGGIATDFDNYIYVLYKSVYNNNIAAIFLDRIDGNGTTFTTHSFAQGGAASTIQTVVVPQSL